MSILNISKINVKEAKFDGTKGYFFIYKLSVTNYIDQPKQYMITCFIGADGTHNNRMSQYFSEKSNVVSSDLIVGDIKHNIEIIERKLNDSLISFKPASF